MVNGAKMCSKDYATYTTGSNLGKQSMPGLIFRGFLDFMMGIKTTIIIYFVEQFSDTA